MKKFSKTFHPVLNNFSFDIYQKSSMIKAPNYIKRDSNPLTHSLVESLT